MCQQKYEINVFDQNYCFSTLIPPRTSFFPRLLFRPHVLLPPAPSLMGFLFNSFITPPWFPPCALIVSMLPVRGCSLEPAVSSVQSHALVTRVSSCRREPSNQDPGTCCKQTARLDRPVRPRVPEVRWFECDEPPEGKGEEGEKEPRV